MAMKSSGCSRRAWLRGAALCGAATGWGGLGAERLAAAKGTADGGKARISITFDLEMSRNFPRWEMTHWDYEKGNLDAATKRYAVEAGRRVKRRGGRIHYFCVGRVLEQPDVGWLKELAREGHPVGNHTYDHVNVLAQKPEEVQFRFQRAPWLIAGRTAEELIRDNIRLTTLALQQRAGIDNCGFRTPGGFAHGLAGREDVQRMLLGAGFTWVSSQYPPHANTQPRQEPSEAVLASIVDAQRLAQPFVYPETGLVEIPMSPISDIGAFRTGRWQLEWFLEAVGRSVDWAIREQKVFDFLAHPSCLGVVDPEFRTLDLICDRVEAAGDAAELVDLDRIARSVHR
ncbi:polysaccharide deacetylase family protein [Candidatus Laterigemmans baculatus]|uniref:polysaccharide deacetylase family protein n=1 Tax=Candidatus Laterigemmans baculatus TaxID=2770505 RepID=UPI00193B5652|nr:polysaccharide deacetylase family protein [Candidatus Laterigemmans baculatus]